MIIKHFLICFDTVFEADHISTEDEDFNVDPSAGSVTFNAGSTSSGNVRISVNDDDLVENEETFSLTLRDPLGGACPKENRGVPHTLNIRILDNDGEEMF